MHHRVGYTAHAGPWEYTVQLHFPLLVEIVLLCGVLMDIFANLPIPNLVSTAYE